MKQITVTDTAAPEVRPVAKRMTKQRRLIREILEESRNHPTAEMVYHEARKVIPDIGLGTVYRNLQTLLDEECIFELHCGRVSRFDGNMEPHSHFICTECGEVFDVKMDASSDLCRAAAASLPGHINACRVEFYGCCDECLKKKPAAV